MDNILGPSLCTYMKAIDVIKFIYVNTHVDGQQRIHAGEEIFRYENLQELFLEIYEFRKHQTRVLIRGNYTIAYVWHASRR